MNHVCAIELSNCIRLDCLLDNVLVLSSKLFVNRSTKMNSVWVCVGWYPGFNFNSICAINISSYIPFERLLDSALVCCCLWNRNTKLHSICCLSVYLIFLCICFWLDNVKKLRQYILRYTAGNNLTSLKASHNLGWRVALCSSQSFN